MLNWLRETNNKLVSYYFVVLFFVIWQVAPVVGWANPKFIPPLSEVLKAGWKLTQSGGYVCSHLGEPGKSLCGFVHSDYRGASAGLYLRGMAAGGGQISGREAAVYINR
ncbi:MAG: hypothetical protein ABSC17_10010 [Thermacetogeniaceae bacterium]